MKKLELKIKNFPLLLCIVFFAFGVSNAQSIRQDFPTPITTGEISGKVPARDIGDARLTNYFYAFNGVQGDVFVNVQTKNFNGDIEIFTANNLKSLTKITIYADISDSETGRVIYLRKPEKLILRIQGRTPNDDDATYRIKFAGSFAPLPATAENSAPELPEVKSVGETDVRVNSVGTIISVKPKPTPLPKETVAKAEPKPKVKKSKPTSENKETASVEEPTKEVKNAEDSGKTIITIEKNVEENTSKAETEKEIVTEPQNETSAKITVADESADKNSIVEEPKKENNAGVAENIEKTPTAEKVEATPETPSAEKTVRVRSGKNGRIISGKVVTPKPIVPNPLENIRLIVLLKDGTKIEHQMSDVVRFNIINGVLTITIKGGKIERHSILDVERTIIE